MTRPASLPTRRKSRGFGAVAALYTETRQVVVRADSDIRSIEDLHGRTVSIGAEESGSSRNARQILFAYGLNDKMVSMVNLNYEGCRCPAEGGQGGCHLWRRWARPAR